MAQTDYFMTFSSYWRHEMSVSQRRNQIVLMGFTVYQRVQDLFQWKADLLMANRLSDLAGEYIFPWTVYVGDRPLSVSSADAFIFAIGNYRDHMIDRGTARCVAKLTALDIPRNGRFRAWVSHYEMGANQKLLREMRMVHYCRDTEAGIRCEMTECWDCSVADFSKTSWRRMA